MSPEPEDQGVPQDLGISVREEVKAQEVFGKFDRQLKGIGGTLHVTRQGDKIPIMNTAWELSQQTGRPVVIVVRAS